MKGFGEKIFELRKGKGISQEDLAKLLKITAKDVDLLENGELEPTGETYRLLSVYFDVPIKELVSYKETPTSQKDLDANVVGKCVKCGKPITKWENFGVNRFGDAQMDFCEDCKKEYVKKSLEQKENDYDYRIKKGFKRATLITLVVLLFGIYDILTNPLKVPALISTFFGCLFAFAFVSQLHFKGYVTKCAKCALKPFKLSAKIFSLIYIDFWSKVFRTLLGVLTVILFSFCFMFVIAYAIIVSPFTFISATVRFLDERKEITDKLDAICVE